MIALLTARTAIMAIGSLQPGRFGLVYGLIHGAPLHRLLHLACFAVLAALAGVTLKDRKGRSPAMLAGVILTGIGFGAAGAAVFETGLLACSKRCSKRPR
jgi:hypothetical protein